MNKTGKKDYSIPVKGMSVGQHRFDFVLSSDFFKEFDSNEIIDANIHAYLEIDKRTTMMYISGRMTGVVTVACDRCLDNLRLPIETPVSFTVKFIRNAEIKEESNDDDIMILDESESDLDMSQFMYDTAILSLPLQRFHEEGGCDSGMMEKLMELNGTKGAEERSPFAVLKKLKN